MNLNDKPRMYPTGPDTNPVEGVVEWSPVKSLWFAGHAAIAVVGGVMTFSPAAVAVAAGTTALTLCLGHSVGFHRLLIHRSFECPRPVEYALAHLGTLVGMGGPLAIVRMHDIRDWAQRHERAHPFYTDAGPCWRDALWQLHCELRLKHPPEFRLEARMKDDPVHRFMQNSWMLANLPLALLLYLAGGVGFVVWGVSVRIVVSLLGHWFVGYLAHNHGAEPRTMKGYAVQGKNVSGLGLITMGEAHHNNHHAFPNSARLGLEKSEADPGWWFILLLKKCGLARNIRTPETAGVPTRRVSVRRGRRTAAIPSLFL